MQCVRYTIENSFRGLPPRQISVDVPLHLAPTDKKVIEWVKQQQPYLIEGEKWEVVKKEQAI